MRWSRRQFLEIAGVAGGAVALRAGFEPGSAAAATAPGGLFLSVYFNGGWDQLALFDPRDNTRFTVGQLPQTRILPGYDRIVDAEVRALLAGNPTGVRSSGSISYGPAIPATFAAHLPDLNVLRGVSMDTLTHEVGRRYFLTGKFPRGLVPSGSSLSTITAAAAPKPYDLTHLSISSEAYNEGLASAASPVPVRNASDVQRVLRPLGLELTGDTDAALREYELGERCGDHLYDAEGKVTSFRDSRDLARTMVTSNRYDLFEFRLPAPSPGISALFTAMGIANGADLAGPKGRAAIAAQALARGVSQSVALQLQMGLDDHDDWTTEHIPKLRQGFDALGRLIAYLKATPAPAGGGTVWDKTTLVVFSEFSRTPMINGRDGRDHHLASSCLVGGPGLRKNRVVGATSDVGMFARKIHFDTGAVDDVAGLALRPCDVHATLLKSMGLGWEHLSNQSPRLISPILA